MPCRCLLAANQPDLAQSVHDYVASLPEDQRCDMKIYQERLSICLSCSSLIDGTCTLCGCYVEARAAKAGLACPALPPRWHIAPDTVQ